MALLHARILGLTHPKANGGIRMSTQRPAPRLQGGRGRRSLVIAIVVAWLMTSAATAVGQSPAPGNGDQAEADPKGLSTAIPIPLTSLGDVTSLEATATLSATGSLKGEEMAGDLTAQLVGDEQGQYRIDITGDLLGPIATQVGGKLVKLFRPKRVSVYVVEDGNYVVVSGLTDICIRTEDTAATEALSQLSPRTLMTILTDSDVANGSLVGAESLDGVAVDHYVVDGPTFLAAAQASNDPAVQAFGQALAGASDSDIYIDTETGYPVRYQGAFSGAYEPVGLDGDFSRAPRRDQGRHGQHRDPAEGLRHAHLDVARRPAAVRAPGPGCVPRADSSVPAGRTRRWTCNFRP